jgi:hypothetical protein
VTPELRAAAFGDRPESVPLRRFETGLDQWLGAVVLGGQGWYAAAAALLTGLRAGADPVLASLAASTLASHRRQVGGHLAARALDAAAVRMVADLDDDGRADRDGIDLAGARGDALIGLAADALGTGRLPLARRLLEVAAGVAESSPRCRIRLHWVRAEVALAAGTAVAAIPEAEQALEQATAAGAVRHVAKSEMVLAAALSAAGGHADRARRLAARACQTATERGLVPLVWPCALLLAELEPASADRHRDRATEALRLVLRRVDPQAERLAATSSWVPTAPFPNGTEW